MNVNDEMYAFAKQIYPYRRSLTGDGVRQTLQDIKEILPDLQIREVPSGTKAFDWTVPPEWSCDEAYVEIKGERVIDWTYHALHLVGYSQPVDAWMPFSELWPRLHSLPRQPNAIPYVTSYYAEDWGFCVTHRKKQELYERLYDQDVHVVIDSTLNEGGSLTYGELVIQGTETRWSPVPLKDVTGEEFYAYIQRDAKEVLLSTYICHPQMANNETSGPVVTTFLAKWLQERERRFTYRIVFVPETIGALVYLSGNYEEMRQRTLAGFQITCVGDNRAYSYLPSRQGDTLADRVAMMVLREKMGARYKRYEWKDRGSDERQYCAPGIDLPVCSVMRSKYGTYPEYHTSLDDLSLISPDGLGGAYDVLKECLITLEQNKTYKMAVLGEPQLGKRGLYPNLSQKRSVTADVWQMMEVISYLDGRTDTLTISEETGIPMGRCHEIAELMVEHGLAEVI